MTRKILSASLATLIVVLTACSGGSGDASVTETTAPSDITVSSSTATPTTVAEEEPGEVLPLQGTEWNVTHLASESVGSITNIWPGTEVTLAFGTDGAVTGNAGCNDYGGEYELIGTNNTEPGIGEERGQAIRIINLSWTEMACDSENLMIQEQEFLGVLPRSEFAIVGTGLGGDEDLLLRSVDDGLLIEGAPAA